MNGPPGSGKSTVAARYADDHPLTLLVDIDEIRMHLGAWREHAESKLLARHLALALSGAHLAGGHDVIVPQLLGRTEFIEQLEQAARDAGAQFREVVLTLDHAAAVARFRARRDQLDEGGIDHPQADIEDHRAEDAIREVQGALDAIATVRGATMLVDASGTVDETYAALVRALEGRPHRPDAGSPDGVSP